MKKLITAIILTILFLSCEQKNDSFLDKMELNDLNGEQVSANQFKDKIVILNLWATWCTPCIKEMPDLEKMQTALGNDFVLILASDEELSKINGFTENLSFDLNFKQIQTSMELLGVYSLPTTFVIDKEGQLLVTLVGARKWDSPEQIERLKNYLK